MSPVTITSTVQTSATPAASRADRVNAATRRPRSSCQPDTPRTTIAPVTDFARLLAVGEITLGAALLLPVVPAAVAGPGLAAFSGCLLGLYARTPGMRKEGSLFPTQQGIPLAKDAWMMSIGLALVIDDLSDRPGPKD